MTNPEVKIFEGYELDVDNVYENPGGGRRIKVLRTFIVSLKLNDSEELFVTPTDRLRFFDIQTRNDKVCFRVASRESDELWTEYSNLICISEGERWMFVLPNGIKYYISKVKKISKTMIKFKLTVDPHRM